MTVKWQDVVKRIEWIEADDCYFFCPFCGNKKDVGHSDECDFVKLMNQESEGLQ